MSPFIFSSQLPPSPGSVTTREVEILVSLTQSSQCWLWHDGYLAGLTLGPAGLSRCPLPLGSPLTFFLLDGTSTQESRHLGSTLWLAQGYVRWDGWLGSADLRRSLCRDPGRQTATAQSPGVVGSCRGRETQPLPALGRFPGNAVSQPGGCTYSHCHPARRGPGKPEHQRPEPGWPGQGQSRWLRCSPPTWVIRAQG